MARHLRAWAPGRLACRPDAVQIAALPVTEFWRRVEAMRGGRRLWRFKVKQVHAWARQTVALSAGGEAMMREIQRIVARADLLMAQMTDLEAEIREMLAQLEEASYLQTMPGVGWTTVAGLLAEIGHIGKFTHGRQLVKLAGLNPSRHESGTLQGRTRISRRGRAGLRTVAYLATLAGSSMTRAMIFTAPHR